MNSHAELRGMKMPELYKESFYTPQHFKMVKEHEARKADYYALVKARRFFESLEETTEDLQR